MPDKPSMGGYILEHIRPEIRIEESTPLHGKIILEPLERGYGVTLGNALRRVLLSSIRGAAVSAVRIEGVLHEFSTIDGVYEDVIELMLNLKKIPVRSHSREVRVLRLEVDGPKDVTVADIQPDSEVEFADPDAPICSLAEGARLEMDLFVERGTGYATSDRQRPSYLPIDALMVDAIFSPVQRVKYEVQDARVGQRTDYERLLLDVWTNGVVEPEAAVVEAAGILQGYFGRVVDDLQKISESAPEEELEEAAAAGSSVFPQESYSPGENAVMVRPIKDLELSIRSENCLLRGGVQTIGDLVSRGRTELLKIRNLGKISLREIEEKLEKFGLTLDESDTTEAAPPTASAEEQDSEEQDSKEDTV
jgi:DNA-directed RNA polymerase subunit alpha